jgi:uncharacterized protein DUF6600/FecR-like protein
MYKPRVHSIVWTALSCALLALPAGADSQARIVRLSDVHGAVEINKNAGLGFETAFANLPITQGTQLRTRDNGRAEIEFEDGSTLRVTPNTTVEFSTLGSTDAGKHVSTVDLVEGRAYVNWLGKSGDEFTLKFAEEKMELTQAAHFRVLTSSNQAQIASLKNDLEVVGPEGAVKVPKKEVVTFDLNDNNKSTVAKTFQQDSYDEWDKQSVEYHDQYAKSNVTAMGYGSSDLSYYGAYTNVAGYGSLWQPFFTGAGWNPYMDGAWSWYPGMGYMWASAYPWGWTPYYYGNWAFVPGFGWGWQPGGGNTWHGGIHYVGATAASFHPPATPTGSVSTVAVGKGGPVVIAFPTTGLVVRSGSAGMGIPRGSYDNLRQFNSQVAKTGSTQLRPAPQFAATSQRASGFGFAPAQPEGRSGAVGHVGSAPAASGHASGGGGHAGH